MISDGLYCCLCENGFCRFPDCDNCALLREIIEKLEADIG